MARLLVKEMADARNMSMSRLHYLVNQALNREEPVAIGTIRRHWHGTINGSPNGAPIEQVDLFLLAVIAQILGVKTRDLINEDVLGQTWAAQRAA